MRRSHLGDAAHVHDDNFIRNRQRLFLVVGHIDTGEPQGLLQVPDLFPHPAAKFRIKIGKRLVKQQHLRLQHQRPGHRHALLLPAGQFRGQAVIVALEPNQLQAFARLVALGGPRKLRLPQSVGHIFDDAHVREQGIGLEHHADVALVRRQKGDVLPADQHMARGLRFKAGNHPQRRGFAAARGPEQCHQRARFNVERDRIDGDRLSKCLGDAIKPDRRRPADNFHATPP